MLGPEYRLSPANIRMLYGVVLRTFYNRMFVLYSLPRVYLKSNIRVYPEVQFRIQYDKPRSHTGLEWRAGSETLGHVTRSRSRLNNRIIKGVRIAKVRELQPMSEHGSSHVQ
jgi:hypothetical protein